MGGPLPAAFASDSVGCSAVPLPLQPLPSLHLLRKLRSVQWPPFRRCSIASRAPPHKLTDKTSQHTKIKKLQFSMLKKINPTPKVSHSALRIRTTICISLADNAEAEVCFAFVIMFAFKIMRIALI